MRGQQGGGGSCGSSCPGCSVAGKGRKKPQQNILTTTKVSMIKFATTVAYCKKLLAILLHSTVYKYSYLACLALMFLVFSTFI